MQSGQCNHFLSLTLPSVSPKESRGGFTHTAQPLGGLRLTLPFNVYMQAPVCLLSAAFLASVSPLCLTVLYISISIGFFQFFFFLAEIPLAFEQKMGISQYGACIWKNQTQHSCSASPIVKARY